jgi:integrase/recombinase XerD
MGKEVKVKTEVVEHRGQRRIKIVFDYNKELIERVKTVPGCAWSQTMKCWHVPFSNPAIKELQKINIIIKKAEKDERILKPEAINFLKEYDKYLKWKRLSESTLKSYYGGVTRFLTYYHNHSISELTNNHVNEYMYYLVEKGYSSSAQNIAISSIKMFYSKIVNKNLNIDSIERPRRSRPLPKVIAREDIEKMLAGINNIKHKAALLLIYSLGLRRSELINLQLKDIDSKRLTINIRNAKGKKDRTLPVSETLMKRIIAYYKMYKPKQYLFEGTIAGRQYSSVSLQKIFHKNMDRVKPGNTFTLHCLRHSYATHLLENGTDIRYIQELLGHKSTRTTEIYTHVSIGNLRNIKTPGDEFNI